MEATRPQETSFVFQSTTRRCRSRSSVGIATGYGVDYKRCRSRSSVGIATGYALDDLGVGVRVPVGSRIFLFSSSSRPILGFTQPPIQSVTGDLSTEVKRRRRESDHSPPTSAEIKKMWLYISIPPIRLHGVVLD
jgi:hypothetical protein